MRFLSWYTFFVWYALLIGMCSICGARSPHGMRYHLWYAMRFRYVYLHGLPISEVQLLSFISFSSNPCPRVYCQTRLRTNYLNCWFFSQSNLLLLNWHYLSNAKKNANLLTVQLMAYTTPLRISPSLNAPKLSCHQRDFCCT